METISEKRNRLYNAALIVSIAFGIILAAGMILFKLNEDYFNGNIRFKYLMEAAGTKEDEVSYPKVNIKVNFDNGGDMSLVIPLETPIEPEYVSVHEEFIENKYVISLPVYEEHVADEINLVGDLKIMDAAGAYFQNGNVTVEVYCNDSYGYDVAVDNSSVTVNFYNVDDRYGYKAVVWTPYSERNRFSISTFEDELEQFAQDRGIKLYLAWQLENEYSQDDIIEFSNGIGADMVVGIDMEELAQDLTESSYMYGVCNTSYFIPEFDSTALSIKLVEGFAQALDFEVKEFEEADLDTPLVYDAVVPTALIRLAVSEKENEYSLTENIIYGIENTINSVIDEWGQDNNEGE